jgi:hypothetical protein
MAKENKIQQHKKALLEALSKSLGVVTTACQMVNIDRSTFYKYVNEDPDFKAAVGDIDNEALDFAESKLHDQIRKGDTTAIIFYLKTKGKGRGYIEKTQVENSGEQKVIVEYT